MNGADAKVPVVYKVNFSYTHFFTDRLKMGVSGFMTLGRNNYMYVDRNMADEPFFRLAAEGNPRGLCSCRKHQPDKRFSRLDARTQDG